MIKKNKAFTLVELSIVLVIIGLIIGGIMLGRYLKERSDLRSVINDFQKYRAQIQLFKDQYDALPGDFNNAYTFWGASCDATPANCNGDQDGLIEWQTGTANDNEGFRAWQHLYLSGIGDFPSTGLAYGTGRQANIGQNVPASKLPGGGYSILQVITWGYTNMPTSNTISLGTAVTNTYAGGNILTPQQAYFIDSKIDDGLAGSGNVLGLSTTTCSTSATKGSPYTLTSTSIICTLFYRFND
jgi:prepilin-type N-terminal cleavage/methylation domain-containing protein